jgi:hypothetical protein
VAIKRQKCVACGVTYVCWSSYFADTDIDLEHRTTVTKNTSRWLIYIYIYITVYIQFGVQM